MKTLPPPRPATDIPSLVSDELIQTLFNLLPPLLDDSPAARHIRNQAATAMLAALLPVGADEFDLAARYIALRGHADDVLWLLRENRGDAKLAIRLSAQSLSIERLAVAMRADLLRMQARRRKRAETAGAAEQDALTQQMIERSLMEVVDLHDAQYAAAAAGAVRPEAPADHGIAGSVPENKTNSHTTTFETPLSAASGNQELNQADELALPKAVRDAVVEFRLGSQKPPAHRRKGVRRTGADGRGTIH